MMRKKIATTVLLAAVTMSACTMIPKYTRPAVPVPQNWPTGPAYTGSTKGPSGQGIGWREFYRDEKLLKVITLAIQNNRDLRIAVLNIERARNLYRIRRADLFPTVNASGSGIESRVPAGISGVDRAIKVRQYTVDLGLAGYELDFFGRVRSLKAQALEQYLATEEAQRTAQISLIAEVANVYLLMAADRERLQVTADTFTSQEDTYRLMERKFGVGASSELDVRQAQTRVEAARRDIARLKELVAQDANALTLLVGSPVPEELLSGTLANEVLSEEFSAGVSSEVLLNRPDILDAEHQLKAANANIGAARAAFFPRITLTTSVGLASDKLSTLFVPGNDAWTFAPQITLPVFDTGRNLAQLGVAKTDRDIAVNRYEQAIQAAFREVADALATRGTIGDQIAAQEAFVDATARTLRLSEARYNAGIDSFLPVQDAQRSLYASQQVLIGLRLARLTNLATLYKALGGGSR